MMTRLAAIGALIWGALLWACGARPSAADPGAVRLDVTAKLGGDTVALSGSTDLPDGALLDYQLQHERWMNQPPTDKPQWMVEGTMAVAAGRFTQGVDVAGWPAGSVEVWVGFQPFAPGQPAELAERFGANGERLSGGNVKRAGSSRRVEAVLSVEIE